VDISNDHFWRNGRYDDRALEKVYMGENILAKMRMDTIVRALDRYEPARETIKGVWFCVTIRHARFMADAFNRHGISSVAYVSGLDGDRCDTLLAELRSGRLAFLFTVDKFSEGVDVPEINMVLFLRPTQSMTVFLQQLGRGCLARCRECAGPAVSLFPGGARPVQRHGYPGRI
jgi:superfamily II DNA or RNA helicase